MNDKEYSRLNDIASLMTSHFLEISSLAALEESCDSLIQMIEGFRNLSRERFEEIELKNALNKKEAFALSEVSGGKVQNKISKEVHTKLYDYNIEAIEDNGGTIENTDFSYLLGTIDYTDEDIMNEMIAFANTEEEYYYDIQRDLVVTLTDEIEKDILDALSDRGINLETKAENYVGKLIAYALGYISYSKDE